MATARQTEANRRNASGSHQMSEEGKAAVRGNAIRHGLATRVHVVLAGEDQESYNQILEALLDEYSPTNTQQQLLVHQIAQNYWRLERARNMETGSLKMSIKLLADEFGLEPAEADDQLRGANQATAMAKHDAIFNRIARYEATAERSYYRSIRELTKLQKEQIRSVQQNAPAPIQQKSTPPAGIRSVPQSLGSYSAAQLETVAQTLSAEDFEALLDRITAPATSKSVMCG